MKASTLSLAPVASFASRRRFAIQPRRRLSLRSATTPGAFSADGQSLEVVLDPSEFSQDSGSGRSGMIGIGASPHARNETIIGGAAVVKPNLRPKSRVEARADRETCSIGRAGTP